MTRATPLLVALAGCGPQRSGPGGVPPGSAGMDASMEARPHDATLAWDLDEDAPVVVRCAASGEPGEAHRVVTAPSDRSVTLFGLLAETEYRCALSAGGPDVEVAFATGPRVVADWRVDGDPEAVWGAYTLLNQFGDHGLRDHVITVFDPQGRVRLAHRLPDGLSVGVDATFLPPDRLLLGGGTGVSPALVDLAGRDLWRLPPAPVDERYHHDAELAPDGTVLVLRDEPQVGPAGETFLGLRIEAWDVEAMAVTWSWSSVAAVDAGLLPVRPGDAWHSNALQRVEDAEGVGLMVGQAETARILRVDQATGAVSWQLGDGLDFALLDGAWFYGAHDPEWSGDRVVMHDNGRARPEGAYSRVVEYAIDRDARTATQLWEWTEPGWFELLYGDADRLPDGHVLVARGHCDDCALVTNDALRSDVLALDPVAGAVSWRLWTDDPSIGLYRAERIDGCALFHHVGYCPDDG